MSGGLQGSTVTDISSNGVTMRIFHFIVVLMALAFSSANARTFRPYDLITDQIMEGCLAISHQQHSCACPSGVDMTGLFLYAEPRRIPVVDEAVELLTTVLPDLDATELRKRLASPSRFVSLNGGISTEQAKEVRRLGVSRETAVAPAVLWSTIKCFRFHTRADIRKDYCRKRRETLHLTSFSELDYSSMKAIRGPDFWRGKWGA
jgi:hypothetical protein